MANNEQQNKSQEQRSGASQHDKTSRSGGTQSSRRDTNRHQLSRPFSSSWSSGSPFGLMRRLNEEMDRWFGGGFGSYPAYSNFASEAWAPNVEVLQRGDELVVRAELPGLEKDDVNVEIAEDAVTIRGERRQEHDEEHDGFYRSERSYGSFYRTIPLPEGAIADTAKANFKNGVLEITVQAPPAEVRRGRRVEIGDHQSTQYQKTQSSQGQQKNAASQERSSGNHR